MYLVPRPRRRPGFFSLEGAKQALGVTAAIEQGLSEREEAVQASQTSPTRLLWEQEAETRWAKLDHLLYLPVLGLTRPRDLYYYQGQGLAVLYGFTKSTALPEPKTPPTPQVQKPKRNDPCWCGSGKKYKLCHMKTDRP